MLDREELAKKYGRVMNSEAQINLNIAFDELLGRVLMEKPSMPINVAVGRVTGKYDLINNGTYIFQI